MQGYGELAQLEQPLVGGDGSVDAANDAYVQRHGVARPGAGGAPVAAQGAVPSQVSAPLAISRSSTHPQLPDFRAVQRLWLATIASPDVPWHR